MNRLRKNHGRSSSGLLEDLILQLVLTAAVLTAWIAGFASLGG